MTRVFSVRRLLLLTLLVPVLMAGTGVWGPLRASSHPECALGGPMPVFPKIPLCAFPGAWRDSSLIRPRTCVGVFRAPLPDSIQERSRTITVRFRRDRRAEARPDFGGYRIYRVTNTPDTTRMVLIRRFSRQFGDERLWNFSLVDTATLEFKCGGRVVHDSLVTFIDPDSSANFIKTCRRRLPQEDPMGVCLSIGDSVFVKVPPPGPHDGVLTWYAITYEEKGVALDATLEEIFVPDTTGILGACLDSLDRETCPNLNNKAYNLVAAPVEPTPGPTVNLEHIAVIPNPYRAREAWDRSGTNEIHFINLPPRAVIQIYTVSGDLVRRIDHVDTVRDFTRWDLKNENGLDVSSGIYMYLVEAERFTFRDRFVVIR